MKQTAQVIAPEKDTANTIRVTSNPESKAPRVEDSHSLSMIVRRIVRGGSRRVSRFAVLVDQTLIRWASKSMWGSRLYYAFWNGAFGREQQAVLQGRVLYAEGLASPHETSVLLRRNCHRLEKGLLMVPRREVFATDYIGETVNNYCVILAGCEGGQTPLSPEMQWAHDVLSKYSQVVVDVPRVAEARQTFEQAARQVTCSSGECVPYQRDLSVEPSVRIEDLAQLSKRRRSVRWFLQQPVPREMIDAAINVAGQSPSACNRQPFQFRVFDEPDMVQRVVQLPLGAAGYGHNIPVMVVIVGQQRNYFDERDRHLIYIDASLAAMGFVYALESQGLSSCCINWPDIESREAALAELLNLSPDERAVMCLAVGYPDPEGLVAYSQKKPLDQLRRYNFE